jgi:hypothetical protein
MDSPLINTAAIDEVAIDAMNRHRRRETHQLSPEQRMEAFQRLQASAWQLLESNPTAMRAFIARNHHKRRPSEVQRLEEQTRGQV